MFCWGFPHELNSRALCALFQNARHRLQPPGGAPTCSELPVIQSHGDPPKGRAVAAEPLDFRQRRLLDSIRFQMLPVLSEPGAERDVSHALALAALVPQRITSPFPDRLALPLAHRAHDG